MMEKKILAFPLGYVDCRGCFCWFCFSVCFALVVSVCQYLTSYFSNIDWFSFECCEVIGFALTTLHDWLKKLAPIFIQSEVKLKPIMTRLHAFSRASLQLHVITSSFDWFTVLSVSFVICWSVNFGFGFTTPN